MGLLKWVKSRAGERSTYVGLAAILGGIATVAGKPELVDPLNDYLPLILTVVGGALVAKPAPEPLQGVLPLANGPRRRS